MIHKINRHIFETIHNNYTENMAQWFNQNKSTTYPGTEFAIQVETKILNSM